MPLTIEASKFRRLERRQRIDVLVAEGILDAEAARQLLEDVPVLPLDRAEQMIENVIGVFALPLALVPGVPVNGRTYDVPMVIEEPSVVAAQANSAKVVRQSGGYRAGATEPVMITQIQVLDAPDVTAAVRALRAARAELMIAADSAIQGIVRRGGGARDVEVRHMRHPDDANDMIVVHLHIDTRDAMGANAVNTAAEACAPLVERITGGRVVLRILSNLATERRAWAECAIPVELLKVRGMDGDRVAQGIEEASKLAEIDPYRAATHNKGALNGIDAVVMATGNDYRAVEAGAHAWAARDGRYTALSTWRVRSGRLHGRIELPLAMGIVGAQVRAHPWVPHLLRLLGVTSATELAQVVAAVGLGQNLGALRALASIGIQSGHMAMHARAIALEVGARPDEVEAVAAHMRARGHYNRATAEEALRELRAKA